MNPGSQNGSMRPADRVLPLDRGDRHELGGRRGCGLPGVAAGGSAERGGGGLTAAAGRRTAQRSWSGMYGRSAAPMYSCRGRPIRDDGSTIISRHCAIQPGSRPMANRTVNIRVGKPSAR